DTASEPERAPGDKGTDAATAACCDAVKEEHGLRTLAQYREADHDRQHIKRLSAGDYRVADRASRCRELAPMARHPNVVPAEHADGEQQNHSIQQLLADAGRGGGNACRK